MFIQLSHPSAVFPFPHARPPLICVTGRGTHVRERGGPPYMRPLPSHALTPLQPPVSPTVPMQVLQPKTVRAHLDAPRANGITARRC